jgi:uncharacterized protein (UPF0332 family)
MKYQREMEALLEKAERSLDATRVLIGSGYYDFSSSRAYYAMFYCAEALLLAKDLKFAKHSAVDMRYWWRKCSIATSSGPN